MNGSVGALCRENPAKGVERRAWPLGLARHQAPPVLSAWAWPLAEAGPISGLYVCLHSAVLNGKFPAFSVYQEVLLHYSESL